MVRRRYKQFFYRARSRAENAKTRDFQMKSDSEGDVPMRGFTKLVLLVAMGLALVPTAARAQGAAIAGVVKDTSGAVLPGVTVEAASPVLIEKTRTAVTDGSG